MSRQRSGGFTLVELIVFIIIVSVGLVGVLATFNVAVKGSADPLMAKQLLRVAEATLQEVLQKGFQNDVADANNSSATLGCTPATTPSCRVNTPADRANYNDVDDYHGFSQTGVKWLDGVSAVTGLENYNIAISVNKTTATLGALSAAANQVKSVTVTVSNGNQSISLVGYRTNYGY